jgi:hypothetical protein
VNLSRCLPLSIEAPRLLAIDATNGFDRVDDFPRLTYLRARTSNSIKITLTWSDYPATPGADKHLVNDLDLRLRSRKREFKGNQWQNGASIPGANFDRVNNVEQVLVNAIPDEVFELTVWNHRLLEGPQPFALVVTGDFEEIPGDLDADQDGLPDGWELWHQGNLSLERTGDPDGDGVDNETEFAANTLPLNPASHPSLDIESWDAEQLQLRFPTSEGRSYVLEELILGVEASQPGVDPAAWQWVALPGSFLTGRPTGEEIRQVQVGRTTNSEASTKAQGRLYRVRIARSGVLFR